MRIAGWFWVVVMVVALPCAADVTAAEVVSKVRAGHPRLMMDEGRLGEIKVAIAKDAWLGSRYKKLRKTANEMLGRPVAAYATKGGDGLLDVSREALERVTTLAMVYRISGEKKYLDRCRAELIAVAGFSDWNPKHFLDTAEMTTAVAIGYDWLYDQLSAQERKLLREAIVEKGLRAGMAEYTSLAASSRYSWPARSDNWNIVCNSGLAIAVVRGGGG